jgi:hypothetical protein
MRCVLRPFLLRRLSLRRLSLPWLSAGFVALLLLAPAAATPSRFDDAVSADAVLKWINTYRAKPDPEGVPGAVRALSRLGALSSPEGAAVYVGFVAGVLGSNPDRAEELVIKMIPPRPEDQWLIVRAIAYSGLPDWKGLMRKVGGRLSARQVMVDKYLAGKLPTLDQVLQDRKLTWVDKLKGYFTFGRTDKDKEIGLETGPELLDTLWGYYFATGGYRPISRIIAMLPLSKDKDRVEKLTIGSMAKFTLTSNAARDQSLLAMLKRSASHQPKDVAPLLTEVIDAAETMQVGRIRAEALAAIEELKVKGPAYRREVSFWGKVGEGTLAVGCIVAAATGHIELGIPCVVGGGITSASLRAFD